MDLGVVKKVVTFILSKKSKETYQRPEEYISYSKYIPVEFCRHTRGFDDIARWKATEFRFFALYSGFVFLKNKISPDQLYHWYLLACSLRLLSDEIHCCENVKIAQTFIDDFVENYPQFYGLVHVNYNVHSLLHLPQYVSLYGPLHKFSGYRNENFMQEIKKTN